MPSTFAQLKTAVARDLRDSGNAVWSTTEVGDLINAGIDEVGEVYPRQVTDYSLTITSGVSTYAMPSSVSWLYRVDVHTSSNSYRYTMPSALGDGPNTGWEVHASILWLPPDYLPNAGDKLRLFGYGAYTQLSVDSATTDLDTKGEWAVRAFAVAEGFARLLADRAAFQQWQVDANNTDITAASLNQLALAARRRWEQRRNQLRKMRKLG